MADPTPAAARVSEIISFGPYRLLTAERRLEQSGRRVFLLHCEFDLLCILIERPGQIVTNLELIARVWGTPGVGEGRLRFHINVLRKGLFQKGMETPFIRKVARRGYVFNAPVSRSVAGADANYELWDGHVIDVDFPQV